MGTSTSSGFRVMSRAGPSVYHGHAEAVQLSVANMVRRCAKGDRLTVRNVGHLLREFPECVPGKDAQVLDLCVAILEHLSQGVPPQDGETVSCLTTISVTKCILVSYLFSSV